MPPSPSISAACMPRTNWPLLTDFDRKYPVSRDLDPSVDLFQSCGDMETLPNPPPGGASDPAAPPGSPRWVMLNGYVDVEDGVAADARTTAASCTSSGHFFSVSLGLAAPPASSVLHYDWLVGGGTPTTDPGGTEFSKALRIVAAHNDAVLIETRVSEKRYGYDLHRYPTVDYFVYEAAGAARPPSLWLLPGCSVSMQFERGKGNRQEPTPGPGPRVLSVVQNDTGLLRRGGGDGEFLVAQLEVTYDAPYDNAELCVLRSGGGGGGGGGWDLKRVPIVHHDEDGAGGEPPPRCAELDAAVPVGGGRFMCWVDYLAGVLVCDMDETESPRLRYVPLPVPPPPEKTGRNHYDSDRPRMQYCRSLASAGADAVRFVSVAPRCCCGGAGRSSCERSRFAFNVTTWTMSLRTEGPMAWVKDGVLDCDELWQLPGYGRRLPRVAPKFPVVSSDDPDVVCFVLSDKCYPKDGEEHTTWMVEIDTRNKALLSVVGSNTKQYLEDSHLPAKLRW